MSEPINFFPINFEESIRYVDELNRRVWREGRERSTCPLYLKVLRRVEDLHATIYALSARVAKLEAEQTEARNRAARLEAALRFYADDASGAEAMAPGCHEHVALWDAINAYSVACGGHPTRGGGARMDAVVRVEMALRAALRREKGAP